MARDTSRDRRRPLTGARAQTLLLCSLVALGCGGRPAEEPFAASLDEEHARLDEPVGDDDHPPDEPVGGERIAVEVLPFEPAAWPAAVACGTPLPGPLVDAQETESQPGYADKLATTDLSALPATIDFSRNNVLQRIVINYMLGTVGLSHAPRADIEASGPLGTAVLAAAAHGDEQRLDFATLRLGLAHFYPCSRPFPASLAALKARYGDYTSWPRFVVECSQAKQAPRRISRHEEHGVAIAETLGADGAVRETEVIFEKLRDDGHLDFAVYTEDGALSDRSEFAGRRPEGFVGSSPYQCVACHMNAAAGTVSEPFPAGPTPAVCD